MTNPQYMIIPSAMKKLLRIHGKVPLNDDEISEILDKHGFNEVQIAGEYINIVGLIRDIEKAHGIE
jgi:hypothetical protein